MRVLNILLKTALDSKDWREANVVLFYNRLLGTCRELQA